MINEEKSKKKILIADDDPVSRHLLKNFLVKWGYDVTVVTDGTEALRILESDDTPRLAVLDWMMPGMEGPQICQQIRKRSDRPYIYVLLLTARNQKKDLLQGLEYGADDYLTKPFDAQELQARLHVGERILNLEDELRFQATHDSLTGISSRSVALEAISREHFRQVREKSSFGIIMADLDHFKNVNDTFGHPAGDLVLKEVAAIFQHSVRSYDWVGRYGGEEFLLILPGSGFAGARLRAEQLRISIHAAYIHDGERAIPITASFGVACGFPSNYEVLIQTADTALYRAKDKGRNCVVAMEVAPSDEPDELPR